MHTDTLLRYKTHDGSKWNAAVLETASGYRFFHYQDRNMEGGHWDKVINYFTYRDATKSIEPWSAEIINGGTGFFHKPVGHSHGPEHSSSVIRYIDINDDVIVGRFSGTWTTDETALALASTSKVLVEATKVGGAIKLAEKILDWTGRAFIAREAWKEVKDWWKEAAERGREPERDSWKEIKGVDFDPHPGRSYG